MEFADDKFKGISLAHDLTSRQRAQVKEVRTKAMDDLQAEQQRYRWCEPGKLRYRIIVVGKTTGKPRAISFNSRVRTGLTGIYVNARSLISKLDYLRSELKGLLILI